MAEIKTLVQTIDDVREWFEVNVCSRCTFKLPSNYSNDETYPYKLVTPTAWAMYMPSGDMLPDGVEAPVPSVTVQFSTTNTGTDNLATGTRTIALNALFATWNPGLHGPDFLMLQNNGQYKHGTDETFNPSAEGWRDAWNFVDTAIERMENTDYVGGLLIDKTKGIQFAPADIKSAVSEAYPFWYAQLQFHLVAPLVESHELLNDYL